MNGRERAADGASRASRSWQKLWAAMEKIWGQQTASETPTPSAAEDDARLRKLRRGWPEGYFGRSHPTQRET